MGAADSPVIEIVFNTDPYIDSHRPFGSTSVYINVEVPRDGAVMNTPGDYIITRSCFTHSSHTATNRLLSEARDHAHEGDAAPHGAGTSATHACPRWTCVPDRTIDSHRL